MAGISTTWTNPDNGTTLDIATGQGVSEAYFDAIGSNLRVLGGADGNTKTGPQTVAGGVRSTRILGLTVPNNSATTVVDLTTIFTSNPDAAGAMALVSGAANDGNVVGNVGMILVTANGAGGVAFTAAVLGTIGVGGVTYSVSGNSLQVTQTSGASRPMQFTILLVSMGA